MFNDKRSKRVIFITHCILNQNVELDGCARYPGVITEIAEYLIKSDVGIIQMACPELIVLGLDRQRPAGKAPAVKDEENRIRELTGSEDVNESIWHMAAAFGYQIDQYISAGFIVLGVIGINGSPVCGVDTSWSHGTEIEGEGHFISLLSQALDEREIQIPFRGIKPDNIEEALAVCKSLIEANNP